MSNTIIEQEQSCPAEQQPIFNNKTELNNRGSLKICQNSHAKN